VACVLIQLNASSERNQDAARSEQGRSYSYNLSLPRRDTLNEFMNKATCTENVLDEEGCR